MLVQNEVSNPGEPHRKKDTSERRLGRVVELGGEERTSELLVVDRGLKEAPVVQLKLKSAESTRTGRIFAWTNFGSP